VPYAVALCCGPCCLTSLGVPFCISRLSLRGCYDAKPRWFKAELRSLHLTAAVALVILSTGYEDFWSFATCCTLFPWQQLTRCFTQERPALSSSSPPLHGLHRNGAYSGRAIRYPDVSSGCQSAGARSSGGSCHLIDTLPGLPWRLIHTPSRPHNTRMAAEYSSRRSTN
jgi:hypothetical protein